jgi:hypothetical protein
VTVYFPTFKPAVIPLTMTTHVRELPFAGEVLVRVGNRVEPDEVVARTLVPARGRRFAVARILGLSEKDLPARVLPEDGSEIEAGDVVVRVGGLRQRVWRCPVGGTLSTAEAEQGYLVITAPAQVLELRAHFKGFVLAVEPYRAVTIQSPVAMVQGAFGLGGEQHGVLRTTVTDAAEELLPEMLDERAALSIVIGGGPIGAKALARAIELRVRGLIVGSVPPEELRAFLGYPGDGSWEVGASDWVFPPGLASRSFPLALMVTEGLGRQPMCRPAFDLLTSYDGAEASLDGQTWLHGQQLCRPQVLIPLTRADPAEIPPEEAAERLAVGTVVRLLSAEVLGQVGTIVGFSRGMRTLACGARYRVADVRLDDGQVVEMPFENLEALGQLKKRPPR